MILPHFPFRFLLFSFSCCFIFIFIGCAATGSQLYEPTPIDSNRVIARDSLTSPAVNPPPSPQESSFLLDLIGNATSAVLIDPLFDKNATNCHDYYHRHETHHGNLSEAMTKAANDRSDGHHEGGDAEHSRREEHHERGASYSETYVSTTTAVPDSSADKFFDDRSAWFSVSYGQGSLKSSDFYGYSDIAIALEAFADLRAPMNRADLVLGGSHAPIQESSKLRRSLKGGVTLLHAGIRYNLYTTPRYTFMGNYVFAGAHVNWMFWSYKNAVRATDYDRDGNPIGSSMVNSDDLFGIDLQVGAGWNVVQTEKFAAGIECTPGVILWSPETGDKFHNDVFDPFVYLRLSYMMHYRFGK